MKKNISSGRFSMKSDFKGLINIMKICLLLLFAFTFHIMAIDTNAQDAIITLKNNPATVNQLINEIEKQTDYLVVYSNQEVDTNREIDFQNRSNKVSAYLNEAFSDTDIGYHFENNYIVLAKKTRQNAVNIAELIAINQQQGKTITGHIADEYGEAVIGASIIVKENPTQGTITDIDGNFTLTNVPENATLEISYVGMETQNIPLDGKTSLEITMVEDIEILDEVVVIGYGTLRKQDLTGAITQVKTEQFDTQQSTNVLDYLNGTVAGFNANIGTSASGSSSMEIRGPTSLSANNSPLIVLDGVIFNGSINDINPRDIETIDILKDASSAAVYGARSAAGVVIINTKRGKEDRISINFSAQLGVSDYTKKLLPNDTKGYLKRRQDFQKRVNPSKPGEYYTNPNSLPSGVSLETWQKYDASYTSDPMETWMARLALRDIEQQNYLTGNSYNWFDAVTSPGLRQNYDANISGGIGSTQYYWSLGCTDNEGYLLGDEYKTIRSRINANIKINDFLTAGVNTQFANNDKSAVTVSLWNAIAQSPLATPYDDEGSLKWYPHDDSGIEVNPFLNNAYRDKLNTISSLFANIYADMKLPFGFNYKISYINRFEWEKNYYYDPTLLPQGDRVGGIGERCNTSLYEWQIDNILSWKKTFGIHDFYVTFLYNAEKKQTWEDVASNQGFSISEQLSYHQLNAGGSPTVNNNDTYSTGTAIMGRLNYTLLNRYLLTLSLRKDGYSAFGINNPYATFPSYAFAWNLSEEPFFQLHWVDHLKIRLSYGQNGNRDIGIYSALSRLGTTKYLSSGTYISGIYSNSMANNFLKWERTKALNFGIDFSLLDRRLSGTIDCYDMTTNDLLLTRSLPTIIGYSEVMSNMGELTNKGFELSLNGRNIDNHDFNWNSSFILSFNRNKIEKLYGEMVDILDENGNVVGNKEADDITNGWFIGQSINRIWDYKFLGIYQCGEEEIAKSFGKAPGDTKLLDVDGNGVSTQEDKVFQGYREPRFRLGLRNDFFFLRNFQFSFFLRADLGHYDKNGMLMHTSQVDDRRNSYALPYWTPENPTNKVTRLNTVNTPTFTIYESRGFLRLQDISSSYNLPTKLIEPFKVASCKIYVSSRNLFTFSKWSGWDPESGNTPMPRIFTFGVDLTL
ncbi:MAG: TonB-dependent receptor [Bacteroidota bacterium]|nr:TonB-dependent receptor [Bacteroidota bacterium]